MVDYPTVFCAALLFLSFNSPLARADPIQVNVPASPSSTHVVQSNFLGISFELSYIDEYFGNDTSTVPPAFLNYLSTLRSRTGGSPLRIRIGGNSMDDSTYVPQQTSAMLQLQSKSNSVDDQPVNYGPVVWDVLKQVSSDIGGATYLIGLSLRDPNNPMVPVVAGDAAKTLGSTLDGFLLGNEPDLYTGHHNRPNIANYTTPIYFNEFGGVLNRLTNTSGGNLLDLHNIGGPTICCRWNLDEVIDEGYALRFSNALKYISLQHYPQNNCFGRYNYQNSYYTQHSNVAALGTWQGSGVNKIVSNDTYKNLEVIMSEFNSASCGGIPSISNTFAVGSLWTVDYALQLASVGYSAAYLHTRERGISYNLFTPPQGPNGAPGAWTTNPPFYGLIVAAEALRSTNGSIVTDLNIENSRQNESATVSGYAVYDAIDKTVQQLVFFNFANVSASANSSQSFVVPAGTFNATSGKSVTVKYLTGDTMVEGSRIGWGGQTFFGAGDGNLVASNATWAPQNMEVECTNGCTISVPAPGMAVVFANVPAPQTSSNNTKTNSSNSSSAQTTQPGSSGSSANGNMQSGGTAHLHPSYSTITLIAALFTAAAISVGL
ncbi:hypothetical protein D9613_005255 [Agrocybe pediades]|uniref:Beta-glucuronidase C-terminal domain-containing protein n=1 Tax=Agrocybe pediades TaxID=84607 RepID=A0A8H4QZ94_9AGAR|nr:hypothetical protein D9613_005255 [Agrocybe pediades]